MERLTLREFSAIADRHAYELSREDFLHARTRQGMTGGRLEDLMLFKQALPRKPAMLGPDGKPAAMPFGDVARLFDVKLPKE